MKKHGILKVSQKELIQMLKNKYKKLPKDLKDANFFEMYEGSIIPIVDKEKYK